MLAEHEENYLWKITSIFFQCLYQNDEIIYNHKLITLLFAVISASADSNVIKFASYNFK
jgi:hypothetical protein